MTETEQAQVGDTVRVTHKGVVTKAGTVLAIDGYLMNSMHSRVEILSRATPPLPSEPNTLHSDRNGDVWKVHCSGELRCLSYPGRSEKPNLYAPFRQLVLKEES